MSETKYKYLAKNTAIFAVSSFGSKLLVFLLVPFYTRVLSTEEYGKADLITTTSSLLIFVVTLCVAEAVIRFAIEGASSREGVFRFGVDVVVVGSSILSVCVLALRSLKIIKWDDYMYLFLLIILIASSLEQVVSSYLRAIDRVKEVGIMGILITLFTIISNLFFLLVLKWGLFGYLASYFIGHLSSMIYGLFVIYKCDKSCFSQICSREKKTKMLQYSVPLIFNGLAWWVNSCLDRYFIIFYYSAALNGIYAVASKIPTILNTMNQIFNKAWNLSAIKEYEKTDKDHFFDNIYSLYNFVLVASCSILILLNIPLARLLFANEFFEAWNYSSILLISTVFSALGSFIGSIFTAVKNSKIFAISTIVAAGVNTVLNWILIPSLGALGAAIATAVSFFVIWLIRLVCVSKYMELKVNYIRDFIAYGLIVVQAIVEHSEGHNYAVQGLIVITIILLYIKELRKTMQRAKVLISGVVHRKANTASR